MKTIVWYLDIIEKQCSRKKYFYLLFFMILFLIIQKKIGIISISYYFLISFGMVYNRMIYQIFQFNGKLALLFICKDIRKLVFQFCIRSIKNLGKYGLPVIIIMFIYNYFFVNEVSNNNLISIISLLLFVILSFLFSLLHMVLLFCSKNKISELFLLFFISFVGMLYYAQIKYYYIIIFFVLLLSILTIFVLSSFIRKENILLN